MLCKTKRALKRKQIGFRTYCLIGAYDRRLWITLWIMLIKLVDFDHVKAVFVLLNVP
jgi:hypothetical protein